MNSSLCFKSSAIDEGYRWMDDGLLGQTLIVTSGCGWVQSEGGPKTEIRAGDIVWCPPKEKHWHGATKTTAMAHIAIQEALDGNVVEWMEKVTDEQYKAQPAGNER